MAATVPSSICKWAAWLGRIFLSTGNITSYQNSLFTTKWFHGKGQVQNLSFICFWTKYRRTHIDLPIKWPSNRGLINSSTWRSFWLAFHSPKVPLSFAQQRLSLLSSSVLEVNASPLSQLSLMPKSCQGPIYLSLNTSRLSDLPICCLTVLLIAFY